MRMVQLLVEGEVGLPLLRKYSRLLGVCQDLRDSPRIGCGKASGFTESFLCTQRSE